MPNVSKVHDAITRFEVAVAVVSRMSEPSVAPRPCTVGPGGGGGGGNKKSLAVGVRGGCLGGVGEKN
jgi:hypothetical protein